MASVHSLVTALGLRGLPSKVASTWLSAGALPIPRAIRCSCRARQCARSSATPSLLAHDAGPDALAFQERGNALAPFRIGGQAAVALSWSFVACPYLHGRGLSKTNES